jgi:uncharacterized protein YndB with AHSA1/START domain
MNLTHNLDRTVTIEAAPETVFRFFQDSERWARWWGAGSTIDPRPGGKVYIRHPNGIETVGEVVEIAAPERIVFTYGFVSGKPIGPGESLVTIRLAAEGLGTRLDLLHEFAEEKVRDEHVQGWRFQLSLFANAVADENFANAAEFVDAWFAGWAIPDAGERAAMFARIASESVTFRDRYSRLDGMGDLLAHVEAAQRFMPGIRLEREGDVRHCQGVVVANWVAKAGDGVARMAGVNVFRLGADGKFVAVTGLAG